MATVIRGARFEQERLLLAVVAPDRPRRAKAQPQAAASAPPKPDWAQPPPGSQASAQEPQAELRSMEEALRERLEAERIEALEEAREQGFAEGVQRGEATWSERLDALGELITSARAALESGVIDTEDIIVEIAFEATCKILGEAMLERDGVIAVVNEVLGGMRERETLMVRVSPLDHEVLVQHRARLLRGDDGKMIDLVADERVALGGCLVETAGGTLDGRLETQLRRLVDMLGAVRRMQGEGTP